MIVRAFFVNRRIQGVLEGLMVVHSLPVDDDIIVINDINGYLANIINIG